MFVQFLFCVQPQTCKLTLIVTIGKGCNFRNNNDEKEKKLTNVMYPVFLSGCTDPRQNGELEEEDLNFFENG